MPRSITLLPRPTMFKPGEIDHIQGYSFRLPPTYPVLKGGWEPKEDFPGISWFDELTNHPSLNHQWAEWRLTFSIYPACVRTKKSTGKLRMLNIGNAVVDGLVLQRGCNDLTSVSIQVDRLVRKGRQPASDCVEIRQIRVWKYYP